MFWILYPFFEVPSFRRFCNLAQDFDLAQHFSCSVKTVKCGQIFLLACRQLQKKAQHNFIGQFYFELIY